MVNQNNSLDEKHENVPGDYYDTSIRENPFQRFWHTRRFREFHSFVKGIQSQKILDVGCHGGRFTQEIAIAFPKAHIDGIDMSVQAISYASKKYPAITFKVARAQRLPYKNKAFDLVTCFEVLEHIEDPDRVVAEVQRVLRKKGNFITLVPAENILFKCIWFLWTHFGPGRVWHHTHVQKFEKKSLDMLLQSEGFTVVKRKVFLMGMLLFIHARKN